MLLSDTAKVVGRSNFHDCAQSHSHSRLVRRNRGTRRGSDSLYNKRLNFESGRLELLRQDKLHERALKCADEGRKFAREYMAEESSEVREGGRFYWDNPEFHYNQHFARVS